MSKLPDFFGIDIGNHSIKVVQIKWDGSKPVITKFGQVETPFGVIGSENEEHQKLLAEKINEAINDGDIKTRNAVVALPEAPIFSVVREFPKLPDEDLREAVYWAAKKDLPIPMDEVEMDYIIVGERMKDDKPILDVLLVAAPKTLVRRYEKIIDLANLEPLALETESIAVTRAISFNQNIDNAIVIDFGANNTDVAVIKNDKLVFSRSLGTGSDALTKSIASDFGFEVTQAEEYKRAYGLDETQLEGKIADSLKPVMDSIVSEILRTLEFFKSHSEEGAPNRLLLLGDGAMLPGLVPYMTKSLSLEVELGDLLSGISVKKNIDERVRSKSTALAVAVGLALKVN